MCDQASEEVANKWMCEYCTYMNYRSSMKCTMCASPKPLLNEDIYRLSPTPSPPNSGHSKFKPKNTGLTICRSKTPSPQPPNSPQMPRHSKTPPSNHTSPNRGEPSSTQVATDAGGRTAPSPPPPPSPTPAPNAICLACSYLNSDSQKSSKKCSQCGHQSERRTSEDLHNDMNDQLKALRIMPNKPIAAVEYGSDPDLRSAVDVRSSVSRTTSPQGSASNLSGSRQNLDAAARVSPVDTKCNPFFAGKWSCTQCTYENWPKSQRCSMCGRLKEQSTTSNIVHTSNNIQAAAAVAASMDEQHNTAAHHNANNQILSSPDREFDDNCATNYIISNKQQTRNNHRYQTAGAIGDSASTNNCDTLHERRIRQLRRQADWQWLHACIGVVDNDYGAVEAYLSCGGNPGRSLTSTEVVLLNRNSAYDVGHTLIHLAIRFHREEMLPMLLAQINGSGPGIKRVPSYVAPDLASDIRRHFANLLRCRKSSFSCHYVNEHATFSLPAEIEELPIAIQEQLQEELFDRDAQSQLECSPPALNWSLEITVRLGSRLMVLWNRSAGDCLLDSAMQATWGVFDRDNVLRRALSDSLHQCGHIFYTRWKEYEMMQAALLHFTLEDAQWEEDWATLLSLARQPGASLEQLHIFTLAHILRRPIVVYGVKYVKSFRGEDIGYARFEGLYLPLLWEQSFCSRSPIALGYTRGHFSALVPTEPYARIDAARVDSEDVLFLPLMDCEHKLLPIHFLLHAEMGREESIMRQWLDVCVTEGGLLVAQQKLQKRPLLVAQMLEEWLNHYRRIAQVVAAPFERRGRGQNLTGYSSDGDTDEE